MRVLVCGGRDYTDRGWLQSVLSRIHAASSITVLIHGRARGADSLAGEWAERNGVMVLEYAADWERYKKAAGAVRNQRMLDHGKPELVLAFPGGRGTADMVGRARDAGVRTIVIRSR